MRSTIRFSFLHAVIVILSLSGKTTAAGPTQSAPDENEPRTLQGSIADRLPLGFIENVGADTPVRFVAHIGGHMASLEPNALVSFTPSDSMRLENLQDSSQSLPTVAPGGSQSVAWLIRADREANAMLTFTPRNASGATVDTVSKAVTITD